MGQLHEPEEPLTNQREEDRVLILSSFNADNLAGLLDNDPTGSAIVTTLGPYGQVLPVLVDGGHEVWRQEYEAALIWTRGEDVIPSLLEVTSFFPVEAPHLNSEVEEFIDALAVAATRVPLVLIPSWVPPDGRGFGLTDMKSQGVARLYLEATSQLISRVDSMSNVFVLDSGRWLRDANMNAFSKKGWFLGKIPYSNEIFRSAAADVRAALRAVGGGPRKVIALDLDGTLWGGVVGEVGWEGLRLGGHDWLGEAFVDFQRTLKSLRNRGILLAIVSKNDEAVALEAIDKHPEMVLRRDDFVATRINWHDKAENMLSLARELNLGLDAFVFIDDSGPERGRVREALPDVLVPDWPSDPTKYSGSVQSMDCFDNVAVTEEDRKRTDMYQTELDRQQSSTNFSSMNEWLESLGMIVTVEEVNAANLPRIVQLLNKTNQMNLSTRRLTQTELTDWVSVPGRRLWAVRVADRFGDAGLTGIVSIEIEDQVARVVDFILSCRVFGRQIERVMFELAVRAAREAGSQTIVAEYKRTERNNPMWEFLKVSGFMSDAGSRVFSWETKQSYSVPKFLEVKYSAPSAQ